MTNRQTGNPPFLCVFVSLAAMLLACLPGCSKPVALAYGQSEAQTAHESQNGGEGGTALVKVTRPTREHLIRTTTQPAQVEPYEKTDIFAKAAGYLQKLGQVPDQEHRLRDLDIGDRVEKDTVLAELWIPEAEQERLQKEALLGQAQAELEQADASLKAAEAMVEAARARVDEATSLIAKYDADRAFRKTEHERYTKLFNERSVQKDLVDEKFSQLEAAEAATAAARASITTAKANLRVEQARVVRARADVEGARAHARVARANLEQARILLDYGKIRAPFAGIITRRYMDTGAFVQSATQGKPGPLFTIVRADRLRIVTEIPESESALVKMGQMASLQVDALRGQRFQGKVIRFAGALDPGTRTMRTEVELDAPAAELRPGMFGAITVELADYADAIVLPTSSLLASGDKPAVMIIEGGKARRRQIELGLNDGARMQVKRGLTGDEQVITDGKNSLREGQTVEIAR
jgi:RND family efflux transporter MFP subunit